MFSYICTMNLSSFSGEKVLCFHGPLLYEAKVSSMSIYIMLTRHPRTLSVPMIQKTCTRLYKKCSSMMVTFYFPNDKIVVGSGRRNKCYSCLPFI